MSNKLSLYTKATKMSLENAEQWIKDAKLLIENSSYGHANALLRFACEEIAKAYVCWLTSEKILPIDNKVAKDVFWNHRVKNEVILGMLSMVQWMSNNRLRKDLVNGNFELSEREIIEASKQFEAMLDSTEKMRQKAIYVDVNEKTKEIMSPLKIDEKEVKGVLDAVELFLKIVRRCIEETSEEEKERWRKVFSSMPREVWETGEIPIEWFKKEK